MYYIVINWPYVWTTCMYMYVLSHMHMYMYMYMHLDTCTCTCIIDMHLDTSCTCIIEVHVFRLTHMYHYIVNINTLFGYWVWWRWIKRKWRKKRIFHINTNISFSIVYIKTSTKRDKGIKIDVRGGWPHL